MQCRPKADGKQVYIPDTKRCVSRDFFLFFGGRSGVGQECLGEGGWGGESQGGEGGRVRSN